MLDSDFSLPRRCRAVWAPGTLTFSRPLIDVLAALLAALDHVRACVNTDEEAVRITRRECILGAQPPAHSYSIIREGSV
jgi:hypothetical protein